MKYEMLWLIICNDKTHTFNILLVPEEDIDWGLETRPDIVQ